MMVIETTVYIVIVYFVSNLNIADNGGRFGYFFFLIFVLNWVTYLSVSWLVVSIIFFLKLCYYNLTFFLKKNSHESTSYLFCPVTDDACVCEVVNIVDALFYFGTELDT